jgi:cardiolipin synthase C
MPVIALDRCRRLLLAPLACALWGCALQPLERPLEPSYTLEATADGRLEQVSDRIAAELSQGESAYWLLERNDDALSARLAVADAAVSTLDVQYFIWQPDESGRLLLKRLLVAADRGVRVRLLLDDFAVNGLDAELAGLDAHPRIEVRVFNPWRHRRWRIIKAAEFLFRMRELNHRMHNKVFIGDNRFAIFGGRNIGNRYFGLSQSFVQNDLDAMVTGPLVDDISASFDLFWNSSSAYPAGALIDGRSGLRLYDALTSRIDRTIAAGADTLQAFPLQPANWSAYFEKLASTYTRGPGTLQFDSPFVKSTPPERLYANFRAYLATARQEVLISSPYFIPDREFVRELGELIDRGVRVAIVTNSLASNNHAVAHTGYKHWRKAVLELGVELYELRPDAATKDRYATAPFEVRALGLHSKAVVIDGRSVFIGSPNIDPRSMKLNTELGAIVEDPELAGKVARLLRRDMEGDNAWRVMLSKGRLRWVSDEGTLRRQPAAGFTQRGAEFFLNLLPFKGQL